MYTCPTCGMTVEYGMAFCPQCGLPLSWETIVPPDTEETLGVFSVSDNPLTILSKKTEYILIITSSRLIILPYNSAQEEMLRQERDQQMIAEGAGFWNQLKASYNSRKLYLQTFMDRPADEIIRENPGCTVLSDQQIHKIRTYFKMTSSYNFFTKSRMTGSQKCLQISSTSGTFTFTDLDKALDLEVILKNRYGDRFR